MRIIQRAVHRLPTNYVKNIDDIRVIFVFDLISSATSGLLTSPHDIGDRTKQPRALSPLLYIALLLWRGC